MKLELKKFDPACIKSDSVIVFIGKRNTGKSYCMKDILSYHQDLPVGVVISPTEIANNFFEKFIPNMLIYEEYTPSIIKTFLNRQMQINKKKNEEIKQIKSSDIDNRAFLILDDCLYDKSWPTETNIRSIFMNGRHYKIFFLITMQYCMGLPPVLRANVDYVFIFKNNIINERMKIYNHYAGIFNDFSTFCAVMDACTENYECIVIDNKIQSNKLEDQVKWYRAKEADFKMCSPELWNLCAIEKERKDNRLAFEDEENEEPYDPAVFTKNKNKNKPVINVKKKI